MTEFEQQNDEAVQLVTCGKRLPGKPCWFVSESEYCRLMDLQLENLALRQQITTLRVLCGGLACLLAAFGILALA
ncbi:MAG: hypothetical protein ACI3W5_15710 [Faecousia sp.]